MMHMNVTNHFHFHFLRGRYLKKLLSSPYLSVIHHRARISLDFVPFSLHIFPVNSLTISIFSPQHTHTHTHTYETWFSKKNKTTLSRSFFFTWYRDRAAQNEDSRRTIWPDPPFWRQVLNCLETPSHLTTCCFFFYIGTNCFLIVLSNFAQRLACSTETRSLNHTHLKKNTKQKHKSHFRRWRKLVMIVLFLDIFTARFLFVHNRPKKIKFVLFLSDSLFCIPNSKEKQAK